MKFRVSDLSLRALRRVSILHGLKAIGFQVLVVFPFIFVLEFIYLDEAKTLKIPSLLSYFLEVFGFALFLVALAIFFVSSKIYRQLAYASVEVLNKELFLSRSNAMEKYSGKSFRKVVVSCPPLFMRFYFDGVLFRQIILLRKGFHLFSFPIIVRLEQDVLAKDFARRIGESLGVAVYEQRWHGLDKKIQ